jgi:DNA adenine methylase
MAALPRIMTAPARPFLKWAGGKSQLLGEFGSRLPDKKSEKPAITRFVEPFVGGGAMFFYFRHRFPFAESTICDINPELILAYQVIRESANNLIAELEALDSAFTGKDDREREAFYYRVRDEFNETRADAGHRRQKAAEIRHVAQLVFLNHTCYNGLFRVNKKGGFNVPFGRYKKPDILNRDNLLAVAGLLTDTRIIRGDFTACRKYVDDTTFVYLDPPYRPLSATASFTSYSRAGFTDEDQERLARFYKALDRKGALVMLSNSDPKTECSGDSFLEDLYAGFHIERVPARRMINCKGGRRGAVSELIVTNY